MLETLIIWKASWSKLEKFFASAMTSISLLQIQSSTQGKIIYTIDTVKTFNITFFFLPSCLCQAKAFFLEHLSCIEVGRKWLSIIDSVTNYWLGD